MAEQLGKLVRAELFWNLFGCNLNVERPTSNPEF
jgi:hypothetical protein